MNPTAAIDSRGFTLIELLIALTIFAVGILAVAAMQTVAMRGSAQSTALTQATRGIVQDKVEALIGLGFDAADLNTGAHGPANVVRDNVTYALSWDVAAGPYANAKSVTVTATWKDLSGDHTVNIIFIKDNLL